ncbi:MAG: MurR/RpiR family transcriptional regulator [Treponema sp.]|nr:MurR/RpiR family transcriptional regulator [Treponema sp.]
MSKKNDAVISVTYNIKNRYNTFSEKEKSIADFIIKNGNTSFEPSITELAEKIGISESTLVRFVKKLGYGGYQKFRIALAKESAAKNTQIFEISVSEKDDIADSIFKHTIKALESSRKVLNKKAIIKTASIMAGSKHILLCGLGGSNINARDAFHKFVRTGLSVQYSDDFHMQIMLASQTDSKDVALVFSHLGNNLDALSLTEELKKRKCHVVVITSYDNSPLALIADTLLLVSPLHSSLVSESFSASIAVATLINVLYVEVMNQLKEAGLKNLNKMRGAITGRKI